MSNAEDTATESPQVEEGVLSGAEALTDLVSDLMPKAPEEPKADEGEPNEAEPQLGAESTEEPQPDDEHPGFKKRIDKLTAQKYELKGELDATKSRIAELENKLANGSSQKKEENFSTLVAGVKNLDELRRLEAETHESLRWAKRMQSRIKRDPEGVEEEIQKQFGKDIDDAEAFIDEMVLNAEEARDYVIPKAQQRLVDAAQWDQYANQRYPWLSDPTHKATAIVEGILGKYGNTRLAEIPEVRLTLARALVGYQAEQKPAPAKQPEPTPQPGLTAGSNKPRQSTKREAADNAAKAVFEGGGKAALRDFVKASLMPN